MAICKPGRELLPGISQHLDLGFHIFQNKLINRFLLLKLLSLWYFVMETQADKYKCISHVHANRSSLSLCTSMSSNKNILPPNAWSQVFSIYTQIRRYRHKVYAQETCVHVYAHTHTHNHTQPHNTQSHVHTLGHAQDCRGYPESHICAHTITHVSRRHTHTHTHTDGSKATGPSLPVACTTRSLGVRGCISGRRELAGRTLVGTDQDSPVVWPPVGMRSWRPAHSRLCSGPAGKPGQLTKPPWSVIEDRGAHVCP